MYSHVFSVVTNYCALVSLLPIHYGCHLQLGHHAGASRSCFFKLLLVLAGYRMAINVGTDDEEHGLFAFDFYA